MPDYRQMSRGMNRRWWKACAGRPHPDTHHLGIQHSRFSTRVDHLERCCFSTAFSRSARISSDENLELITSSVASLEGVRRWLHADPA